MFASDANNAYISYKGQTMIGVLDSGQGGLSILYYLQSQFPQEQFLYMADTQNFPYSEKTPFVLRAILKRNVTQLVTQGCTIIVVACNTATVLGINWLRLLFPNITFIGTVPAIKPATVSLTPNSSILLLATKNTVQSQYLKKLLAPHHPTHHIVTHGTTDLVKAVEVNNQRYITTLLSNIRYQYSGHNFDGIVIGCTHFSLIENQINHTFPQSTIFDSRAGIAKRLATVLESE